MISDQICSHDHQYCVINAKTVHMPSPRYMTFLPQKPICIRCVCISLGQWESYAAFKSGFIVGVAVCCEATMGLMVWHYVLSNDWLADWVGLLTTAWGWMMGDIYHLCVGDRCTFVGGRVVCFPVSTLVVSFSVMYNN